MKVYLSTLGCKLNESEIEAWARRFANDGYDVVDDPQSADMVVLNTCTVTHVAARKSRQMARQLARTNPNARLVLTGCYVSVAPDEAKKLPNVSLVVPNAEKDWLVQIADGVWHMANSEGQATNAIRDTPYAINQYWLDADVETQVAGAQPTPSNGQRSSVVGLRTRAFIKIQDGCNMSCTYCIIPIARGKERSRSIADIVGEVKTLVDAGYKEIILTGVQISSYRWANFKFALPNLVATILSETTVPRLRLTSIAPWEVDEALLDLFSDPRLCRHLHLSLQCGSDTVLRRMRRPYTTAQFARAVELIRAKIPDVGITTDVIVGFPGESQVEFEQSLEFVERMQFSRVHVFPYSARAGTIAASLPLQVSDSIKASRMKQMQAIAETSMRAFAERFVGQTMKVLWEAGDRGQGTGDDQFRFSPLTPDPRTLWSGYTDNYIRVVAPSDADLGNVITRARLAQVVDDSAIGEVVGAPVS